MNVVKLYVQWHPQIIYPKKEGIIGFPMHNEVVHDLLIAKGLLSSSFKALAQTNKLQASPKLFLIIFVLFL